MSIKMFNILLIICCFVLKYGLMLGRDFMQKGIVER